MCDDGKAVRLGPPACLETPARTMSATEEQWHDWRQLQLTALAAAEEKAAAREEDAGAGSRTASQEQPRPRAAPQPAEGPAGKGTGPLSFEQCFVDRAAPPKGVTFDHLADILSVSIDSDTPPGRVVRDDDAAMHNDAEDPAGDGLDDDDAVPSGAVTPVWPPADTTLAQLEDWLETIRRLPADDVIYASEGALENRIAELRRPKPKGQASPLALVPKAKRATEKRRRQLQRFVALRDGLVAEEDTLKLTIADANASIEITGRLLKMAGETAYKLFCEYSASQDAPGRVPSPDAADPASADAARRHCRDPRRCCCRGRHHHAAPHAAHCRAIRQLGRCLCRCVGASASGA